MIKFSANQIDFPLMDNTYKFLKQLKKNNNREWFVKNKSKYELALEEVKEFQSKALTEMNKHDVIDGQGKLFRIYRDVRFSNDKTPYKSSWSGSFKRATTALRGGYYFHIEPGNSYISGGFFGPNAQDLLHIRKQISGEAQPLRKILSSKSFISFFQKLNGDQVKTAPKGFSKDDPDIDLIRYKQFIITHYFTDQEVLQKDFPKQLAKGFKNMRPFFDYMTNILTTDLNGTPLY